MVFVSQCKSREGCFRLYPVEPVADGEVINWVRGRSVDQTNAQDTTRKAGPVYDMAHGYRQTGLETRFWCSRASEERVHWTEVRERVAVAALFRVLASNIPCFYYRPVENHSSRRHYGRGRRRSSIARRSLCMAFLQRRRHAPCDRSADVRAHGQ